MRAWAVIVCLASGFVADAAFAADDRDAVIELVIRTEKGDIEVALYPNRAPVTVANFLRYVDAGHFSGGSFYRVVRHDNDNGSPKIEVIQGGANLPGAATPFPPIAHETTDRTGLLHKDGTLSMARSEVGSATHAFFICLGDQPGLDFGGDRNADHQGFATFGQVTKGMDVVRAINRLDATAPVNDDYVKGQVLEPPIRIMAVTRR